MFCDLISNFSRNNIWCFSDLLYNRENIDTKFPELTLWCGSNLWRKINIIKIFKNFYKKGSKCIHKNKIIADIVSIFCEKSNIFLYFSENTLTMEKNIFQRFFLKNFTKNNSQNRGIISDFQDFESIILVFCSVVQVLEFLD